MTETGRALFAVAPEGYDRLMGRYLPTLGAAFAEAAEVGEGQSVLDVGCGPGGLTRVLLDRVGPAGSVAAIDPSSTFVVACRKRNPRADVREGMAERLPWRDASFDASLASLVVGFMTDAAAGIAEMRRVVRPGGRVAASFWTLDAMPLLNTFWRAAHTVAADAPDGDGARLGRREGDIAGLLRRGGLVDVVESRITGTASYAGFEDWWSSFTGGAGPVGAYQESLTPDVRTRVRALCADLLGNPNRPFTLDATAWCAVGTVPGR